MEPTSLSSSVYKDVEAKLSEALLRARALLAEGVEPIWPLADYLRALGPVLTFIHDHPLLQNETGLCPLLSRAMLRIAQELESPSENPLPIPPPLSVEHEEAIRTGVLLLAAYRGAIEQAVSAKHIPELGGRKSEQLACEFGVGNEATTRDPAALANGISRFLAAAVRYPEALAAAGLSLRQLGGLSAHERVLRAQLTQRNQQAVSPGLRHRKQVMHLALEHFFDRFEAALDARLWNDPTTHLRGLKLTPGAGSSNSGRANRLPPRYAACQLTDSGRLIFS